MRYILSPGFALRGWQRAPHALLELVSNSVTFLGRERFMLLHNCDGLHEISAAGMTEPQKAMLEEYLARGIIEPCGGGQTLAERQKWRVYPARYKAAAQWSITGRCNLRCRHCFMSAPEAALGEPSLEQCLDVVAQLAECGVGSVSITGGEPLVRRDFWQIVDALCREGIRITTLFTNGVLLDGAVLDGFESRGLHPQIQFSFDGVGCHDWLRGVDGAERAVTRAMRLSAERGFEVSAAMCLNRRNAGTLRDTVRELAALGCSWLKVNNTCAAGEWLNQRGDALSDSECFALYLSYIPQFFADGAPLSLMLDGMFAYSKDERRGFVPYERGGESGTLLCPHIRRELYVSPQGRVLPCMSLAGSAIERCFPLLFETPLCDILGDSDYMRRADLRLADYLAHNADCADCKYAERCCGGCRASAIGCDGLDYLARDEKACAFFREGWADKITELDFTHNITASRRHETSKPQAWEVKL